MNRVLPVFHRQRWVGIGVKWSRGMIDQFSSVARFAERGSLLVVQDIMVEAPARRAGAPKRLGDDGFDPDGVVIGGEIGAWFDGWVGDAPDA